MFLGYKTPALILFLGLIACKKSAPPPKMNTLYEEIKADDRKMITPEEAKTYHVNAQHQYEYRTGKTGHYEYNYDVKGVNTKGDSVFGNINIEGKKGAGILINDSLSDIEIKAEWIDYGKLKARDNQGNEYYLKVK